MDRSEGEKPGAAERTCFESESEGSRASRSRRSVTPEARSAREQAAKTGARQTDRRAARPGGRLAESQGLDAVAEGAQRDNLTPIYCLLKISFQYIGGIVYV